MAVTQPSALSPATCFPHLLLLLTTLYPRMQMLPFPSPSWYLCRFALVSLTFQIAERLTKEPTNVALHRVCFSISVFSISPVLIMAGGSERRSLLDGDILKRERTAGESVDHFLMKLVDVFNFQIQEQQVESALEQQQQQQQRRDRDQRQSTSNTYTAMESSQAVLSPLPKNPFLRRVSAKLTQFVLNSSIDEAVKENPMELGMEKSKSTNRSSWLDELRDRATLSSEKDLLDDYNCADDDDDDDLFFQTDDESGMLGNYQIMV